MDGERDEGEGEAHFVFRLSFRAGASLGITFRWDEVRASLFVWELPSPQGALVAVEILMNNTRALKKLSDERGAKDINAASVHKHEVEAGIHRGWGSPFQSVLLKTTGHPGAEDAVGAFSSQRDALQHADVLVAVNGVPLADKSFNAIVDMLKRLESSERLLDFFRPPVISAGAPPNGAHVAAPAAASFARAPCAKSGGSDQGKAESKQQEIVSPVQTRIQGALKEDKMLRPLAVKVVNESYWYASRRRLGPAKQMQRGVRFDKYMNAWEAYIYVYRVNWETGEYEAMRQNVGWCQSEMKASKCCEAEMRKRDSNPTDMPGCTLRPEDILATHFRVLVVSEAFVHKSNVERTCLVYEGLQRGLGRSSDLCAGMTASEYANVRGIRGFSGAVGHHVLSLTIFTDLSCLPSVAGLLVECRTPGQWVPDRYLPPHIELFGGSLHEPTTLSAEVATAADDAHRLRLLLFGAQKTEIGVMPRGPQSPSTRAMKADRAQLLGVVVKYDDRDRSHKEGGLYDHFYHGRSSTDQKYIDAQYKEYLRKLCLVRKDDGGEESRAVSPSYTPPASPRSPPAAGTQNLQILHRYRVADNKLKGAARRMQRMFRATTFQRAVRRVLRRDLSVLKIQRILRGFYARAYTRLLSIVVKAAVVKLQSLYRGFKGRLYARHVKAVKHHTQSVIARYYKGHLARRYVAWVRTHSKAAIRIQIMVRGFLGRCEGRRRRLGVLMETVFVPAAIRIQRHFRGLIGRKQAREYIWLRLFDAVAVPCARCIQRVWRGARGRRRAAYVRHVRLAAAKIQGVVRGFLERRRLRRVRRRMHEHDSAIVMQRAARGFIECRVVMRRREKRYHAQVVIPAAMSLQAHVRGFLTRISVKRRRRQWFAALKLQHQFRRYRARKATLERWADMRREIQRKAVLNLQRVYRGRLGRRRAKQRLLDIKGERLYAARIIMRAITRYRYGMRFRKLMDQCRVQNSAKLLMECSEEKRELQDDMDDIDTDIHQLVRCIQKYDHRAEELKMFRKEAQLRLLQVEAELDELNLEDIEGGWGEALEAEWESLQNRLAMTAEELRQLKIQIRNCEDDIMKLKMEREDYEVDLELFHAREVAEYERLGRMEIERSDQTARDSFRRKVYRQKCRWKDSTTRRKLLARELNADFQQSIRALREATKMGSLSSEKHFDRADEEAYNLKLTVHRERRRRAKEMPHGLAIKSYTEMTDSIIGGTRDILKAATHSLRRPVDDLREASHIMCATCGHIYDCKCRRTQCHDDDDVPRFERDELPRIFVTT